MKAVLITSSILILVIAALRPLLRGRFKPLAQYALWLVVAVRLLVPWEAVPSAHSALALLSRAEEQTHVAESISQFTIPAQSSRSAWDQALREYEQENGPISSDGGYGGLQDYELVEYRASALMRGPTLAELAAKYARPVWLGGGLVMGLWFLLVNLGLRRKLRRALPVEADCPLPVYVTPELPSPCLCGLLRPAVYVTPAALADPDRLRHVLTHELTHYCHKDHWWALVRCLCLCVYWFDPLVWWAAAMSRQDCELACDEGAIRRLGEAERIPYGRTLVAMIAAGRNPLLQTATTMTGGKRRVKERVELIARRPKTVIALVLAAALVLGLTVGFTFTGAPEEASPLSAETLRERLETIPEELRGEVALFHPDASQADGSDMLAAYILDNTDPEWGNRLLTVRRLDQEGFENWLYGIGAGYTQVFARDSEYYYAFTYPSDVQYSDKDADRYAAASRAIGDYARKTVLETEGVEPFDGGAYAQGTLQDRLLDIPDELKADVTAAEIVDQPDTLAAYWMNRDWIGQDDGMGWLLSVRRFSREEYIDILSLTTGPGCDFFARSGDTYFALTYSGDGGYYPPEEAEAFHSAYSAVRAYAREQVMSTQGMESIGAVWSADDLQERLLSVPLYLQGDVLARTTDHSVNAPLASYWMNRDWTDLDGSGLGWLLSVRRLSRAEIEERAAWDNSGWECFARIGDAYYAIAYATDVRFYTPDDAEPFHEAFDAIRAYAMDQVLATEGAEPYSLGASFPNYRLDGLSYAPVTSYEDVPEDPEQWYLVGRLPEEPIWMFTRNRGEETMFQVDDRLTQVFPYRACIYGGGWAPDGRAPQLMRLEGGGGPGGTYGTFAVITHLFQGGTDQLYQLTVYDLDVDPVAAAYVHDWRPLMDDFNRRHTTQVDPDRRAVSVTYEGQSAEFTFHEGDELWDNNILKYGFSAGVYDTCMQYAFNRDGTANLMMPVDGMMPYSACWTIRFTGGGFETVGFRFIPTSL